MNEFRPFSKDQQLGIKAGTPEAEKLLKRSTFAKRRPNESNKYGASKAKFLGTVYDSEIECEYAKYLEALRLANEIKEWKPQHRLDLKSGGVHIAFYKIDFKILHNDGRIELCEVKGFETKDWKLKFDLAKAAIPMGEIEGIPKDSLLTLVKKSGNKFVRKIILLNYT